MSELAKTAKGLLSRARAAVVTGVVAVVVVVGLLARTSLSSQPAAYRTAVATRASVTQTLRRSGTIEPIAQAAVAFPISGTVTSVSVAIGQPVSTGQTLATLDTTSLDSQLAQKKAALAQARLSLATAVAQANAATSTSTTVARQTSAGSDASAASQAVADDQRRLDAALAKASQSLNDADATCQSSDPSTTTSTTSPSSSTSSTSTSTTSTSTPNDACSSKRHAAQADQQAVAQDERALAADEAKLAKTSSSGTTSAPASRAAASTPVVTPAQLVADQAAVDAAQADVNAVEQNMAQTVIVSPLAGTVAGLTLIPGTSVSAGSATANVVIVGEGGFETVTTVPVSDITKVKLADDAVVVPDGTNDHVAGKVVAIGLVPTTSGTSTTYPITIGLVGTSSGLRNGASAAVSVQVAKADAAVTVPTSAVRVARGSRVVTTLVKGAPVVARVQVGSVDLERTEITSGLTIGETVVLADLGQPIPASNAVTATGGGGFGGGGRFGARPPGGD